MHMCVSTCLSVSVYTRAHIHLHEERNWGILTSPVKNGSKSQYVLSSRTESGGDRWAESDMDWTALSFLCFSILKPKIRNITCMMARDC